MATKKATQKEEPKEVEKLDLNKTYKVEVIKDSGKLNKGEVHIVSGDVANVLLSKKLIKIK